MRFYARAHAKWLFDPGNEDMESITWGFQAEDKASLRARWAEIRRTSKVPDNPPWWQFWKPRVWTLRFGRVK